jgi:hypothetical protein
MTTARDVGVFLRFGGILGSTAIAGTTAIDDYAIERVRIVWGRRDVHSQPDVSTAKLVFDIDRAGYSVDALPFDIGTVVMVGAFSTAASNFPVFSGRIAEMSLYWDDRTGHTFCDIVADDPLAQLAHVFIGDEPWNAESARDRAERVRALLPPTLNFETEWGSTPEQIWVLKSRDVDRQPALTLLQDVARSTDAALYMAHGTTALGDTTPMKYLFHSARVQHPGRVLDDPNTDGTYTIELDPAEVDVTLNAGMLSRAVEFVRSLAQLTTRAIVGWWDAGVEANVDVRDAAAEQAHGSFDRKVATELVTEVDAQDVAARVLVRGTINWQTDTLAWDANDGRLVDPDADDVMCALLAGRSRYGMSIAIEGAAAWVPEAATVVFLEGGVYEYLTDPPGVLEEDEMPGRWIVELHVVPAGATGAGITWSELETTLPGILWVGAVDLDPSIRWVDLATVGV